MEIIARYIHGSEDSTDLDVIYVVDELPSLQECKTFCSDKEENRNLITVENGIVTSVYKGTQDEVNNALLDTYKLHEQEYPLLVERKVERDVHIKAIRAVRGILSHLSKSMFRPEIKNALRGSWSVRIETLQMIYDHFDEIDFDSLQNNMSGDDVKKLIAFQIGQVLALTDFVELYTKSEIASYFTDLKPYLYRNSTDNENLKEYLFLFIHCLTKNNMFDYTEDGTEVTFGFSYGTYDVKIEKKINK
jgi:hypothetical protein